MVQDSGMELPVGHGGVEDLVGDVAYHFRDKFFLYGSELLCGVVLRGGGELALPALVVLGVGKADVYRHFQLYLRGETVCRNRFVELVVSDDFTGDLQIAAAFYEFQSCLVGIEVLQLGVEHRLHGCPSVGRAVGNIVDAYCFEYVVVDICSREPVAHARCRR